MGNKGNAILPFVSVAVNQDQYPFGTTLMIPALKGKRMPTGVVHNGCVRADDVGTMITRNRIDFFAGSYAWKKELDSVVGDGQYTVTPDECTVLDYNTGRP